VGRISHNLKKGADMKWFKQNWWRLLFFTLAVATNGAMDHLNFHVPHDSGWWSLHTEGYRGFGGDAWHSLKWIMWTFVLIGMSGKDALKYYVLLSYAILNSFAHGLVFKRILGRKDD